MKKLMFAMTAVAAGAALAGIDIQESGSEAPLKKGVYSLTLTHKFLDYTTKSITISMPKNAYCETKEAAVLAAMDAFDKKVEELSASAKGFDFAPFDENAVNTKYVKNKGWSWSYKFTGPSVNSKKIAATKVQSATINGLYVVGYDQIEDGAYLWNSKVKDTFQNEYVNPKNPTKLTSLICGYAEAVAINQPDSWTGVSRDGKAAAGFDWNGTMVGWGTGTANKGESGDYEYVKAVSGNTVDQVNEMYGTWKFQADTSSTKLAEKNASIEEILAKKKVELVK